MQGCGDMIEMGVGTIACPPRYDDLKRHHTNTQRSGALGLPSSRRSPSPQTTTLAHTAVSLYAWYPKKNATTISQNRQTHQVFFGLDVADAGDHGRHRAQPALDDLQLFWGGLGESFGVCVCMCFFCFF